MKRSVTIFGWSTIVVSVILILSQLLSLAISNTIDQFTGLLGNYPGFKSDSLGPLLDMFEYNRIWSVYSIVYFLATFAGAILFVRFKETGRRILEITCWVGMLNACVDTVMTWSYWKAMENSMHTLVGGMAGSMIQMDSLGLGTIIFGFLIWVIPSIGILVYLRRPSLKALMVGAMEQNQARIQS
ncbi:MAG TPA: hypothetical protein VFO86_08400 [Terriglobia bacterium]|nr:hypothetical protein [Terriglobia bacterium]